MPHPTSSVSAAQNSVEQTAALTTLSEHPTVRIFLGGGLSFALPAETYWEAKALATMAGKMWFVGARSIPQPEIKTCQPPASRLRGLIADLIPTPRAITIQPDVELSPSREHLLSQGYDLVAWIEPFEGGVQ